MRLEWFFGLSATWQYFVMVGVFLIMAVLIILFSAITGYYADNDKRWHP